MFPNGKNLRQQRQRPVMADFSDNQKKIIKRFYDNREQIDEQRLTELVADLYLATGKKRAKLWDSAKEIMLRLKVPAARVEHLFATDDPAQVAEVVNEIQRGLHG